MTATRLGSRLTRALLVGLLASGCALLTKAEPLTPRYFSAEPSGTGSASGDSVAAPRASSAPDRELKLGRVTSASYLGERLVFRDSPYELGFYEDRRWTEKPEAYFRRALSRALYEQGGFRRVVSGAGPTLDCELVEFAELRAPAHVARARVNFVLYDSRSVRTEATVTVELPIAEDKEKADGADKEQASAAASVAALALALTNAVDEIVRRLSANLDSAPSTRVESSL
jgi:cholesterol transport system auxiliary component